MPSYPVVFGGINHQNIKNLELLISKTFPVSYSENFYDRVVNLWKDLSCYAIIKDVIIGAITCRIEEYKGQQYMYILALSVFQAYRRGGVASQLYDEMIIRLRKEHPEVVGVYIHTPSNNDEAIKFYEKKGFKITERLTDYYMSLEVKEGAVLEKLFADDEQPLIKEEIDPTYEPPAQVEFFATQISLPE